MEWISFDWHGRRLLKAWKIKDWGARPGLFEVSQSRRYKNPDWLPIPIHLGGGHYRVLMSDRDGQSAYAIFVALACYAASCHVKGCLVDRDGAIGSRTLAARIGVPKSDMDAAISLLSSEEIGWLQPVPPTTVARIRRAIRSEHARSMLGERSDLANTEQEQETAAKQEQDRDISALQSGDSSATGFCSAAAASLPDPEVLAVLSKLWRKGDTAAELAEHPNATLERVHWLTDRIIREKPGRRHGFMRKGITEGWDIPTEWLERWQRANGARA